MRKGGKEGEKDNRKRACYVERKRITVFEDEQARAD